MKYQVKVLKVLKAEKTEVGIGVSVPLRCVSKPMIALLRREYIKDKTCLIGDIDFLFSFDGVGLGKNDHLYKA